MKIEFDLEKHARTLSERGLDFLDAPKVFEGRYVVIPDDRQPYSEERFQTYGYLGDRLIMFAWTPISGGMRIFSMRKCNDREHRKFEQWAG